MQVDLARKAVATAKALVDRLEREHPVADMKKQNAIFGEESAQASAAAKEHDAALKNVSNVTLSCMREWNAWSHGTPTHTHIPCAGN